MLVYALTALGILWLLTQNFRRAFAIFAVLLIGGAAASIFLVEPLTAQACDHGDCGISEISGVGRPIRAIGAASASERSKASDHRGQGLHRAPDR
jgi:hypothetical protein